MQRGKSLVMILLLALAIPAAGIAAKDEVIVLKGGQKAVVVENKVYFLDASGKRFIASPGKYRTPDGMTVLIIDVQGNFQRIHERW